MPHELKNKAETPWKKFHAAMKLLRANKVRNLSGAVTPSEFQSVLQKKIDELIDPDRKKFDRFFYSDRGKEIFPKTWTPESELELKTTPSEIADIIISLNESKAKDMNGMTASNIKRLVASSEFRIAMARLWNGMIKHHQYPTCWSEDRIFYIWKGKGSPKDPCKQRPITIVICVTKILEKLLVRKASKVCPIPGDYWTQHAYREKHSTATAVIKLDEFIRKSGMPWIVLYLCDIKGAFETLWAYATCAYINRCSPIMADITRGYLRDRKVTITSDQFPEIQGTIAYKKGRSTPQGSCASPWLFSVFLGIVTEWFNEIHLNVCRISKHTKSEIAEQLHHCAEILEFADDTNLINAALDLESAVMQGKETAEVYLEVSETCGVSLEPSKTEIITSTKPFKITCMNHEISTSNSAIWVGYEITLIKDSHGNDNLSISMPQKKKFSLINSSMILADLFDKLEDRIYIFKTYVKPCIDYLLFFTDGCNQLEKLECKLLKIMLRLPMSTKNTTVRQLLPEIETIEIRMYRAGEALSKTDVLPDDIDIATYETKSRKPKLLTSMKNMSIREKLKFHMMKIDFEKPEMVEQQHEIQPIEVLLKKIKRIKGSIRTYIKSQQKQREEEKKKLKKSGKMG